MNGTWIPGCARRIAIENVMDHAITIGEAAEDLCVSRETIMEWASTEVRRRCEGCLANHRRSELGGQLHGK